MRYVKAALIIVLVALMLFLMLVALASVVANLWVNLT